MGLVGRGVLVLMSCVDVWGRPSIPKQMFVVVVVVIGLQEVTVTGRSAQTMVTVVLPFTGDTARRARRKVDSMILHMLTRFWT